MKRSDLFRRYADVIDMCEGTKVIPCECIKFDDESFTETPYFDSNYDLYTFAIAIVEDKPVFVGDVLYHKDGTQIIVHLLNLDSRGDKWISNGTGIEFHVDYLTWTKPDQSETLKMHNLFGEYNVKVKFTKNSITGKISAEVVDE